MADNPWDVQPGETAKAFKAFTLYRNLEPAVRSIDAAGAMYYEVPIVNKHQRRQIGEWSSKYGWVERVKAWDQHLDSEVQGIVGAEIIEARLRHAATARDMMDKVVDRLATIDPEELSAAETLRWFVELMKAERLALGDAGQIIETRQPEATEDEAAQRKEAARQKLAEMQDRLLSEPES